MRVRLRLEVRGYGRTSIIHDDFLKRIYELLKKKDLYINKENNVLNQSFVYKSDLVD